MKIILSLLITSLALQLWAQAPTAAGSPVPAAALTPAPASPPGAATKPAVTPQTPNPVPVPSAKPIADYAKPADMLTGVIEDYNYNPEGKRDPFAPLEIEDQSGLTMGPLYPLQKYDLDQLKLVGIIWDVSQPKAMLMDPVGKGYVVKVNEKIGRNNGYVARIREGEIVIIEGFKGQDGKVTYQTKIMKLSE